MLHAIATKLSHKRHIVQILLGISKKTDYIKSSVC